MGRYLDIVEEVQQAQQSKPVEQESPQARCARLDRERNATDRRRRRGYDYDCSHPEHAGYLQRTGADCQCLHGKSGNSR
jgi:hypothetical protein